jgi:MSHA biogenesis protein MshQ
MTYTKQGLFILLLFVVSSAQAELPPQLSPPLDNLTIYSSAAITMGASSIVGGNIQVEAAATIGASSTVSGHLIAGAAVTLDATVKIGGFVEARDAGTIGADSTVAGHFTTGDAATLGATTIDDNIIVGGDLTAGAAILVGTKAVIGGNVRSGASASTDFGANAVINGNATAGTALTLGADVVIGGNAQAGSGAIALGVSSAVAGNARAGTSVTLADGATVGGTITQGSIEQFTNPDKEDIDDQSPQVAAIQAALAAMQAPEANQLTTSMTVSTTLKKGVYHTTALTTTAGITIIFDGEGVDGHWLINSDSFVAFGASTVIELLNVTPNSTITWNAGGYISAGASVNLVGSFFAGSYILTGASTTLEGVSDSCGGLFTTTGAVTLGASNLIGTVGCKAIPLLEYRFEEAIWNGSPGEIFDHTGNGYNAQVNNNSTPQIASPVLTGNPGTCGYASQNDGSIQAIGLPLNTTTNGIKTTVTFWMNWNGENSVMPIGWHLYGIWMNNGSMGFNTGNDDIYGISSAGLANGWHHVAVEFTNGNVTSNRMHINGIEQVLTQRQGLPNNSQAYVASELRIGGWSSSDDFDFHGLIDEVRVYQSALTTGQIDTIVVEQHPCLTTTPLAIYRFDESAWAGNAEEVIDETSNFSAQAINGALTKSVNSSIVGNPGTCGYGSFDGDNDYIALPNSFENLTGSFTITAWINPSNIDPNSKIFIDDENDSQGFGFSLGDLGIGQLRFYSRAINPVMVDTTTSITPNTWTFVAAVHNSVTKTRQIYINGVAQTITGGSTSNTYTGTWGEDNGPTTIGGETDLGDINSRFTGDIDEVKVYSGALTENQIAAVYTETHACIPVINHYEIAHDGQGLTCDSESVLIKACTNESCSNLSTESVTLDFLADGAVISSPSFVGSTDVLFNHSVVETLTFSLANATIAAANSVVCDDSNGTSCDMTFTDAGFRFLYGTSNSTTLPNQTAGSEFSEALKLQAVKNSQGVCTGLFDDKTAVNLSQENLVPNGTSGLSFSINIAGNNIAKHPNVTSTELTFGANSIATIPIPIYHDAGKIRLHAHYEQGDVTLFGSSNPFWVSPAKLVVSANLDGADLNGATATATPTHAAGESFTLTVSAFNSLDVITPNYSPGAMQLKLGRTGPTLTDSVDGNLTYATASLRATSINPVFESVTLNNFSSGQSIYTAAQYSEVGLLNLDLQDSNYGNVGIVIDATDINIGRFIPDYFTHTVAEHGAFMAVCNTTFAYSGQTDAASGSVGTISYATKPVLAITARNKQGAITKNYYEDVQGSANDYMKLSAANISITAPTLDQTATGVDNNKLPLTANMNEGILSQHDLTALPTTSALPKGVLHYQLSDGDNFFYNRSANTRVVPFSSDINFSTAAIIDADGVKATTTVDASPTGVEIRFGRLVLQSSFGPETSNLPQPMQIEHFTTNGFIVSSDNNCVSYDSNQIALSNMSLDPALTGALPEPPTSTGDFFAGKTRAIQLAAPGAGYQGKIGVYYEVYDWLKYDWNGNDVYDENPSAVASFGQYRGNDRIISWQEVFNQ